MVLLSAHLLAEQTSLPSCRPPPAPTHFPPPPLPDRDPEPLSTRQQHTVTTLAARRNAVKWMITDNEKHGKQGLCARTLRQFPNLFSSNYKANIEKASLWWKNWSSLLAIGDGHARNGLITKSTGDGKRRYNCKALTGRGRKRTLWTQALQSALLSEFEVSRAASVKITPSVLRQMAISLVLKADSHAPFAATILDRGVPLVQKITTRWIQSFMMRYDLVMRKQTGKLAVSPEKQLHIEKSVAFHLGVLRRGFASGELNEDYIENADETHFIFNMDNGRTVGLKGDNHVRYADVVSGDEGITMIVRVTGGRNARIETSFLVFKNPNSSYPIRNIPDDVPGACYRTGPRGWVDNRVFIEWLSEPRAIKALPGQQERVLYMDNAPGHRHNEDVEKCLNQINTKFCKLPPNTTDLVQPADSFIIAKIKSAWRDEWDKYKSGEIARGAWSAGSSGSSGKLRNPGKRFFLKLAANAVRNVNQQRDNQGISFARKAMIRTGMSLNLNGVWEERQLFAELQEIIAKHRVHFEGQPIEHK